MPLSRGKPALHHFLVGPTGAPVVVLIGGVGSTLSSFGPLNRRLSADHRLLCYEHRGTGGSEDPDLPVTVLDYARDLVGLLDELGLDRVALLGHSFGGRVALELALAWPQRVRALIVGGTSPGGRAHQAGRPGTQVALRRAPFLDRRGWEDELFPAVLGHAAQLPSLAAWRVQDPPRARGSARQWEAYDTFDVVDRLGGLSVPTMVLHGEEDALSPVVNGERLAAGISGARLVRLAGVGHSIQVEAPEQVASQVRAFLRGTT